VRELQPDQLGALFELDVSNPVYVGLTDWMDENSEDGKPWIGLLMIRADRQRQLPGLRSRTRSRSAARGT
jgi:hypothetical protein